MRVVRLTLLIVFFTLISCHEREKTVSTSIAIDLIVKGDSSPVRSMRRPFSFLDSIPKEFKGVTNSDSAFIAYWPTIRSKDWEGLFDKGLLTDEVYNDTPKELYALSGYKQGNQFYVLDKNGNKDFEDDELVEFDKNLKFRSSNASFIRDSIVTSKIHVNRLEDGAIYEDEIFMGIYPDANYLNYKDTIVSEREKLKRELLIVAKTTTFLFGMFEVQNMDYKVAINDNWGHDPTLIFREKDSSFYTHGEVQRQEYSVNDTIKLGGAYFKIGDFSNRHRKLSLEALNLEDDIIGFRKGDIVQNQKVLDLDGNMSNFKNLVEGKDLLLLDFWGTWCAPCKELTPDIVELHKRHKAKVNFASLAFELDPGPVRDYTIKNDMAWFNGIIKGIPKSRQNKPKIITDLRVEAFPTFILLDSDLKIVFRGHGGHFKDLKKFLDNYSYK